MNINHWLGLLDSNHKDDFYFEISGPAAGQLAADIRKLMARNEKLEAALREITESARLVGDYYHVKIARKALEKKDD